MSVYVDLASIPYGRMKMCHMVADSSEELHMMAVQIGVARKWVQKAKTPDEHFDICLSKRRLAVEFGAVEVTMRELAQIMRAKPDR